jgi:L-cysteine desulfidase
MNTEEKILKILEEEVVPAEGCTEPTALAYARDILKDDIKEVIIRVSVREGLMGNYGVNIGKIISDNIEAGIYG